MKFLVNCENLTRTFRPNLKCPNLVKRKIIKFKTDFLFKNRGGGCVIRSVRFHGWLKFESDTNTNNVSTDLVINSLLVSPAGCLLVPGLKKLGGSCRIKTWMSHLSNEVGAECRGLCTSGVVRWMSHFTEGGGECRGWWMSVFTKGWQMLGLVNVRCGERHTILMDTIG